MGTAYTPGLKVSADTDIEKIRRLPLQGEVLVKEGDEVFADTIVARTELPGLMQTIRLADRLGIPPGELKDTLTVQIGDAVQNGTLLARTKGLFGRFFKSEYHSVTAGTVEMVSLTTGHLGIREAPLPVERTAYIKGRITQVIPKEGVTVSCRGALIQGIFGVGGERQGEITIASENPQEVLIPSKLNESQRGKVVVGGSCITPEALRYAAQLNIAGIICGGIIDRDLMDYLAEALEQPGYDIGVAITGQEAIPFSLILTEGFGNIPMADRTFHLLKSLEGKTASINGATQIRAGVIRPELVAPLEGSRSEKEVKSVSSGEMDNGSLIRLIRAPYFGLTAVVTELPTALEKLDSGAVVRVLRARLEDGQFVTVPRANVELIETS